MYSTTYVVKSVSDNSAVVGEGVYMKQLVLLVCVLPIVWSCGDNANNLSTGTPKTQNQTQITGIDLNSETAATVANNFCTYQKPLQIISTSLLSAYSVKGNGSDLNYCGGTAALNENGLNFDIALSDYCVNAIDAQYLLNGTIYGVVESGANFTSDIPDLSIVGNGVDLLVTGNTRDGRADDMFINLTINDQITATQLIIEDISIKKGELDFGYITFPDLGPVKFKFIDHFNPELTKGQVFFYGANEEITIVSADNGSITVVYKESKLDAGILLESNCSG